MIEGNLGEERFLNSKNAHFREIAIEVRVHAVMTYTFSISQCYKFWLGTIFLTR